MSRIERRSEQDPGSREAARPNRRRDRRQRAMMERSLREMDRIVRRVGSYYQSLLSGIGWNPVDPDVAVKTVGFTSNSRGTGVSTLAAQAAMTAAINTRCNVLLIDGNLNFSSVHNTFRTDKGLGLSNALRDSGLVSEAIHRSGHESLFIMPAGDDELAGQECGLAFSGVLKTLAADYQLVIVDLPSLEKSSAVLGWVAHLDAILLVIPSGAESTEHARSAVAALRANGAREMSVALNRFRPDLLDRAYRKT